MIHRQGQQAHRRIIAFFEPHPAVNAQPIADVIAVVGSHIRKADNVQAVIAAHIFKIAVGISVQQRINFAVITRCVLFEYFARHVSLQRIVSGIADNLFFFLGKAAAFLQYLIGIIGFAVVAHVQLQLIAQKRTGGHSAVHIAVVFLNGREIFEIDFDAGFAGDQPPGGKRNLSVAVFDHIIVVFTAQHLFAVDPYPLCPGQHDNFPFAVFSGELVRALVALLPDKLHAVKKTARGGDGNAGGIPVIITQQGESLQFTAEVAELGVAVHQIKISHRAVHVGGFELYKDFVHLLQGLCVAFGLDGRGFIGQGGHNFHVVGQFTG